MYEGIEKCPFFVQDKKERGVLMEKKRCRWASDVEAIYVRYHDAVSYTHLDVYKRQGLCAVSQLQY